MHATLRTCLPLTLLLAACSPKHEEQATAPAPGSAAATAAAAAPSAVAVEPREEPACTHEPRTDEHDKRPRCAGMAVAAPRAYRVAGGSGDPVDQVVCDIDATFVLDGKLFGVEFSGGEDGTWKFVRTPSIPGLRWSAGGRYHVEFTDGDGQPGTLTTEGGGTTTAGTTSRETTGGERFTLTPVEACKQ